SLVCNRSMPLLWSWLHRRPSQPNLSFRWVALAAGVVSAIGIASCSTADGTGPDDTTPVEVGTIVIDTLPPPIERGMHQVFTATVKDPKGKVITVPLAWRSSIERVATIDASGRLLARDTGLTVISASSLGVTSQGVGVRVKWEGAAKIAAFQWTPPNAATPATPVSDSIR